MCASLSPSHIRAGLSLAPMWLSSGRLLITGNTDMAAYNLSRNRINLNISTGCPYHVTRMTVIWALAPTCLLYVHMQVSWEHVSPQIDDIGRGGSTKPLGSSSTLTHVLCRRLTPERTVDTETALTSLGPCRVSNMDYVLEFASFFPVT